MIPLVRRVQHLARRWKFFFVPVCITAGMAFAVTWASGPAKAPRETPSITLSDLDGDGDDDIVWGSISKQSPTLASIGNKTVADGSSLSISLSGSDGDGDALTYSVSGNPSGSSVNRMCGGDMPGSNTLGSLSTHASGWSFVSAGFAE